MKKLAQGIGLLAFALAGAAAAHGTASNDGALVVTASNARRNQLIVYNANGQLLGKIATGGEGGVSGNAGGIAQDAHRLAVVNFGSGNISVFEKAVNPFGAVTLRLRSLVPALANPVSVAFGEDHLYILTTSYIESHRIGPFGVERNADGRVSLAAGDGSAAQVGVAGGQLVISEKSNVIETVGLDSQGRVGGKAKVVADIPANVNAPFGLATRGDQAYVSIAHANEISLVRDNAVLTVTGSGTQSAPCWLALDGPFLFSANTASDSVSRYVVYGRKIIQEAPVVASFQGGPSDITYRDGMAAVVDADGSVSHVSVFNVDDDGGFALRGVATIDSAATNGIAIVTAKGGIFK